MLRNILFIHFILGCFLNINAQVTPTVTKIQLDSQSSDNYGTVCGQYSYFEVFMPYPCKDLNIFAIPTRGEPDIYVSRSNFVTLSDEWTPQQRMTWAVTNSGDYSITISHWDSESSPGNYFIAVYDDCSKQILNSEYKIFAQTEEDDSTDIFQNKVLSLNKRLGTEQYNYYRFCVPTCSDIRVTLTNCLNYADCPDSYSYPELLVTRTQTNPTIYDYTYKLASSVRRNVFISHTDPSARDLNGFLTGGYYVGVYGWCTPFAFIHDNTTDGPCPNVPRGLYNVTVEIIPVSNSLCPNTGRIVNDSVPTDAIEVLSGVPVTGTVFCNNYMYYKFSITDPCTNMNIFIVGDPITTTDVPELAVGKWPNLYPTFDNLEWTSYDWVNQNLSISAWDPNFDGGYTCGPNKDELCTYIIGVFGYCVESPVKMNFTMTVTASPAHAIYQVPQLHQTIMPRGSRSYEFCVRDTAVPTSAEIVTWDSSCECPTSYANLAMVISKSNPGATLADVSWRLPQASQDQNTLYLTGSDPDVRVGTYYLNVYNNCSSSCADVCTCYPCSNVLDTKFSLIVSNRTYPDYTADVNTYLGSCPSSESMMRLYETSRMDSSVPLDQPSSCSESCNIETAGITEITLDATYYSDLYSTSCSEYTYFRVEMIYPCRDLNVTVFPTQGEPDLYVSKLINDELYLPTKSKQTWAAFEDGVYSLTISLWDPESSPGYYYIGVYNDCSKEAKSAVYKIRAQSSEVSQYDSSDILQNKFNSMNKYVGIEKYEYYRFCVPACSDIRVTLTNCLNYADCPDSYSYPELLVTRTQTAPTIYDYTYKLASSVRRNVFINHTDLSARDRNGYLTGSYYVGVYGWCTPYAFIHDNTTDGPCPNVPRGPFNVTVELFELPKDQCNIPLKTQSTSIPSDFIPVQSGVPVQGTVLCNDYVYYQFNVTDPCTNMNIFIVGDPITTTDVPELAVGKWPNLYPTFDNLEWTSYDWVNQNLSISAWDPNFDGGYTCGPNKDELCTYIIGVFGYCVESPVKMNFTMTVTASPAHAIYQVPQLHQTISPGGSQLYQFCARSLSNLSPTSVSAEIMAWTSACNCPDSYSNLQMVISKTDPNAAIHDLSWRLSEVSTSENAITLSSSDPNARPGSYYVNVWNSCEDANECNDKCTCSPCSNVNKTKFSLVVSDRTQFNYTHDMAEYLGDCPASTSLSCAGSGTCSDITPSSESTPSSNAEGLSVGAKVGIAIGALVIFLLVVAAIFVGVKQMRYKYTEASQHDAIDDPERAALRIEQTTPHLKYSSTRTPMVTDIAAVSEDGDSVQL